MRCIMFLQSIIIILLLSVSSTLAVPYEVRVVASFDTGDYLGVSGINNLGDVIGRISGTESKAFVWSEDTGFTYLTPLEGYGGSNACGINDRGQVVGYSFSSDYSYDPAACLWEEGNPVTDIGALPSGEFNPESGASAINNEGLVVGLSMCSSGYLHAFLWSYDTGIEDITPTNDGVDVYANDINDNEIIVGRYGSYAFIWSRDSGIYEISIPGTLPAVATGINNWGQVICNTCSVGTGGEAYLWQEGHELLSIGVLPGNKGASAEDINNWGQVVGISGNQAFFWDAIDGIQPMPLPLGHVSGAACGINDYGVIAGYTRDDTGRSHLVLWTPVPEPSSLLTLAFSLLPVGVVAMRRRRK